MICLKKNITIVHIYEKVDGSIFLWSVDWDSRQGTVDCCGGEKMGIVYYVLKEDMLCLLKCVIGVCKDFIDY